MSVNSNFQYEVSDINNSIRRTNNLLRAVNAVRNLVNDIKDVWDRPTATKFFWTIIQLSRTYTALRRLFRVVNAESNLGASLMGIATGSIMEGGADGVADGGAELDFSQLTMRVDAFRENLPMSIDGLDISNLPEKSMEIIQMLLEADAEETVADAKAILVSRILHPEQSTGFLESSIYWQPEIFGTRIIANAPYAWWVEQGHDSFPGHWYMQGATDLARQRLPQKISEELNQLIFQDT